MSSQTPSLPERLTRRLRTNLWKVPVTSLLLAQFALWSVRVDGANLYWDPDGNSANNTISGGGLGGPGTWDTVTNNWWNLTSDGKWVNGPDTAIFSGTGGTVTLGTTIDAGGLTVNSNGYVITGDSILLNSGVGSPAPTIQVNGFATKTLIESTLVAIGGFSKSGNGTLVLANSGHYIGGDIAIRSGALVVSDANFFSNGTTAVSVTGVAGSGNFSGGSLVLAGPALGQGMTVNRDLSVSGRGTNLVNNTGALVSIGNNTLSGSLTIGTSATETRVWATHGTTTVGGNVYLGSGAASIFQGNGNWTIAGVVTGPDTVNDRFVKTGNVITTTMWLQNADNNFGGNVRIDSGTVRVRDVGALGRNMHTAAVEINGGTLEVRTDNAASFFNRNLSLRASGSVYAGRAIGGEGLNQDLTLGGLIFSTNAGQTYTFNSRDGYKITIGTGGTAALISGNPTAMVNNSNNLLTLNTSLSMSDGTGRANTLSGNGDWLITGNILSPAGGNHTWNKSGTGFMTLNGTAGTMTGSFSITGTVAATSIDTFNANGNGALQLNGGALVYRGTGETRSKLLNLSGTTGVGVIQANQTSGSALIFNGKPVGAGGAGTKTLYLGGTSASSIINQISGVVSNNSATNLTSLSKIGPNTWLYSPEAPTYLSAGSATWVSGGAANANTFVVNNVTGTIAVGQAVTGTSIPAGTVVTGWNPGTNTVSLSNNIATALAAGTFNFGSTSNFTGIVTVAGGKLQIRPAAGSGNGSDVINDLSGIAFGVDALTGNHWAGGTFEYLGLTGGSTEIVGPLNPAAGQGNVMLSGEVGGTTTLTFASVGSTANTTAVTTATTTVTVASTSGLAPGMVVTFPGSTGTITVGAITNATQFTLSSNQTIPSGTQLTFSRPVGSLLNIDPGANGVVNFATATGSNGILGGYVTFGPKGTDFATSVAAGEAVAALTGQPELPVSGGSATANYQTTGNPTGPLAAQSMNSLKMSGEQTLTLAGTQTITSGGILFDNSTGAATINHNGTVTNALGASGSEVIIISNGDTPSNALTVNTRISGGTGSLTKGGEGLLVLGVANLYTGTTTINAGTVQLTGTGTIGNGANLTMRQGTTLDLNGISLVSGSSSAINTLNGPGVIKNSAASGTATLQAGGGNFTGLIQEGPNAKIAFVKTGAGTLAMTQAHTYSGVTTITAGNLDVTTLANIGLPSGIGKGDGTSDATNAASLIFNGGSLRYIGANTGGAVSATQTPSVSIDRLFTLAANGRIDSFGSYGHISQTRAANHATLIFNNTADLPFSGTGVRAFTLGGDSTGDNEIRIRLRNNPNANEALTFNKVDAGLWILNPTSSNTYTGTTTISGGALQVASENDSIQGLSASSPLVLNGGVLQTSGTFANRSLGAPVAGTGTTVQIPGGASGFAASLPEGLVVTIGGGDLTWGAANFNPSQLVLGSGTALGATEFTNNIEFGTAARTVTVNNNGNTGTMVTAGILPGVLSGGTGSALIKGGGGVLILGNANTYTGNTTVTAGNLVVTSVGNATGTVSSSLGASGGTLIYNPGDGDLNALNYVGAGETASRPITFMSSAAHTANRVYRIDSSGTGPLVLNGLFTNTVAGTAAGRILTMELRGANSDLNQMNMVLTNSTAGTFPELLAVTKTDGGVWVMNPATPNSFTGNLNISGGTLGLTSNGIGTAGLVSFSNAAIFAHGGDLTISRPVNLANNTQAVFVGTNSITIDGTITKAAGNNDQTIVNNLEGSALLTVNGNFINAETTNNRVINIRGTNSIQWNGLIPNSTGAGTTGWNVALHPDATLTMGGAAPNTYTGITTLSNGTLRLSKVGALGTTGVFAFNGGTLTTNVSGGLVGTSAIPNPVQLNASPPRVAGTESIQFSGVVALGAGRNLENALSAGQLILSGGITNTAASTFTIYGSGNTLISGPYNAGTGVSNLTMSGTGSLALTGTNLVTGILTVNRSTVTLSGTSGGTWNAGTIAINPGGTLTLDNDGGDNAAGRLNDAGAFAANGGTLNLIGDANGTAETAGALTLNTTASSIIMSGAGSNSLTFASVAMGNSGGSLDLSGVPSLGTTNKVIFNGTLPAGFVTNSVAPRLFVGGSDFATYDAVNGVRAFTAYNNSNDFDAAAVTDTLNVTANASTSLVKTINALKINGTGITVGGSAGDMLVLTSGGLLNTGGNNTISVPAVAFGANAGFIQVAPGTTLTMDGAFTGSGGLSKALTGTLQINEATFVTGTQSVMNGTLKLNGGLNTLFPNQGLMVNVGATLDLNGNAQYVERLSSSGVLPGTGGTIMTSTGTGTLLTNMAGSTTFAGQIMGDIHFARTNGNTLTLESAQTYTGTTLMMGGTLALENDATLLTTTAIDLNYATLSLNNNSGLQTANYNRIGDLIPITLRSGGVTLNGRISTAATETFGVLTAASGANAITSSVGGGTFSSANATFASLVRQTGATVNFGGTTLGQQGNTSRIYFTTPPQTYGGGFLGGWAIANSTDYAAYNTSLGVGVVGQGGFAGYDPTFGSGKITELSATGTLPVTTILPGGGATTGMLRITGNFTNNVGFANSGDVLNLELGGILRSANIFDTTIGSLASRGVITAGTPELVIFNNATGAPTFGGTTLTLGTAVATMTSTVGLRPGMTVTHANLPAGTTVLSVDSYTQVTLSNQPTTAGTSLTLATGSAINGETSINSAVVKMNSTVGLAPGMTFTGTNIPAGTYILSVDSPTEVTLSQKATATATGLTNLVGGVSNLIVNSVIADGTGPLTLVKSGAGVMNLSANNLYTGGTVVSQGTVNLTGTGVVLPAGGLTITGATVIMNTNAGQIAAANDVTLNGSSTLTMVGNNTLASLAFNNNGGAGTPIINTGGLLTLSNGASPITVTSSNPLTTPTVAGFLDLGSGARTMNIPAILVNGAQISRIHPTLHISAAILSPDVAMTKTGAGILQLSGQSSFNGLNITSGGILISGNSTPASGGPTASGPLGAGSVTAAAGTTIYVDGTRSIANDITFAGTPTFDSTANTVWTLNLNGQINGLSNTPTIHVGNPSLTVALMGVIPNIGSITSFNRTGLGNLAFNSMGYTGDYLASQLGSVVSLLHDGNPPNVGNGVVETINLGNVIFDAGVVPNVAVGRAGGVFPFNQAVNKIIAPASITPLGAGLTVTNNNGYGLRVAENIALTTDANAFTVSTASGSNVTQGLTLAGVVSGNFNFVKAGAGAVVLSNSGNTFGGAGKIIDITGGIVSVASDSALGHTSNSIRLNINAAAGVGLRATDTFTTARTITLNTASNAIEVVEGKVLTVSSPFGLGAVTNALAKNDQGTLVLEANNSTWTGIVTINQGAIRATHANALGTAAGNTVISTVWGALEVAGGITIAEPLSITSGQNIVAAGVNGGGALRSVSGVNTYSGPITLSTASATDAQNRSALISVDSGSTLTLTGGVVATLATTGANRDSWVALGGAGTGNVTTTGFTFTGALANSVYSLVKTGTGTWNLGVANAFTGQNVYGTQGTLVINSNGTLGILSGVTGTVFANVGGTIRLDSSVTSVDNRLGGRSLDFRGAAFDLIGGSGTTNETTVGTMTFNPGKTVVTVTAQAGGQANLTTGNVTRNAGSTVLFRGSNLGAAAGAGNATIKSAGATGYAFVGQAGGVGTLNKAILPWGLIDTNLSGVGTGFATADSLSGILRPLAASEQNTSWVLPAPVGGVPQNVALSSEVTTLNNGATMVPMTVNSLRLNSGGGVAWGPWRNLTIESGGILAFTGNTGISGGLLTTTSNRELIVHALGDLEISSPIIGVTGGLTKSGAGTLYLSSNLSTFTGTTTVNEGTLKLAGGLNPLFFNQGLQMQNGTLDLNGAMQAVTNVSNSVALARNDVLRTNTGGTIINTSANQAILTQLTGNASFSGRIGNDNPTESNIAVIRSMNFGSFTDWNVYSDNTYTGPTFINGGRIQTLEGGRISQTSAFNINGGALLIGASNISTGVQLLSDRINPNAPITMRGGLLQYRARAGSNSSESLGVVSLLDGMSVIDFATPGTGINSVDAVLAGFSRDASTHSTVRFMRLGSNLGNASRLLVTGGVPLTNNIIGGWAVSDREFASYALGSGIGGLNSPGFASSSGPLVNAGGPGDNIRITTATTTTLTDDRKINTLSIVANGNSVFNLGGNTLTLSAGGLIASNFSNSTAINFQNGSITSGDLNVGGDLYIHAIGHQADVDSLDRDVIINASIVNNGTGPVTLVLDGDSARGTANFLTNQLYLRGANSHTGGTFVNAGSIVLDVANANGSSTVAIPGNLTIVGGRATSDNDFRHQVSYVQVNSPGQIKTGADLTLMGGGVLNLDGNSMTIGNVNINHTGGNSPALSIGNGTLTLDGNVTAASASPGSTAFIGSYLVSTQNTTTGTANQVTVRSTAGMTVGMAVTSPNVSGTITAINGPTSITVSANSNSATNTFMSFTNLGTLSLGGANRTFNVAPITVNGWQVAPLAPTLAINSIVADGAAPAGIIKTGNGVLQFAGNLSTFSGGVNVQQGGILLSNSTVPTQAGVPFTGPVGTGTLTVGNGAKLLVDGSRSIANTTVFQGDPVLQLTANVAATLALNGPITLAPTSGAVTINLNHAGLTAGFMGKVTNAASITSVTKQGLGNLSLNVDGFNGTAISMVNNGSLGLLADGNLHSGLGTPETLSLGAVSMDGFPLITVGRAGGSLPLSLAQNKTISVTSLSSLSNGATITNNNGFGLVAGGDFALANPNVFSVATASASNLVQGLTLNGVISGSTDLLKIGAGTLVLGNSSNSFGGLGSFLDIQGGVVSVDSDGALGNASTGVRLNVNAATAVGLRATGTFATSRVITLNQASNAIEVTVGNTLTLNTAFGLGAVANGLAKNDGGTLKLNAANPTWTGVMTINGGALLITNAGALGTTAGNTVVANNVGAALQITDGLTLAEPLNLSNTGINTGGALQSVGAFTNVVSGAITLGAAATIGADAGSALTIKGGISGAQALTLAGAGDITIDTTAIGAVSSVTKIGSGTTVLNVASTAFVGALNVNAGIFRIRGSGVATGGTGTVTIQSGGTLIIDDSVGAPSSHLGGRPVSLTGGTLTYIGSGAGNSAETFGALTTARPGGVVTTNAGAGFSSTLTFASLTHNGDASIDFSGTNLGTATNRVLFTTAPTAIPATSGILARVTVNGTDFASYNHTGAAANTNGVQAFANYNATAGSGTNINSAAATDTIQATSAMTTASITGSKTINALKINGNGLTVGGAAGSALTLTAASVLNTGGDNTLSVPIVSFAAVQAFFASSAGTSLNVTSTLTGTAGFVKGLDGTVILSTPSNLAGIPNMSASTLTGNVAINGGILKLNGGNNTLPQNQFMILGPNSTLDLNGTSQYVLGTRGDGGVVAGNSGTFTNSSANPASIIFGLDNGTANLGATFTQEVGAGALGVFKGSNQIYNFYNANTHSGPTVLAGATNSLLDAGTLSNTSVIDINSATLQISNAGTIDLTDRVNDSATINLRGGQLYLLGRNNFNSSESVGVVNLIQGGNFVRSDTVLNTGQTGSAVLTLADITQANRATVFFNSTSTLGQMGSTGRIVLNNINGAPAASALTNNIIGAWAVNQGSNWASYIPTLGVGGLSAAGFANYEGTLLPTTPANLPTHNLLLAGTPTVAAGGMTTVNTVNINNVNLAFANDSNSVLNVAAGGILKQGNTVHSIGATLDSGRITAGGTAASGTTDLYFYNNQNVLTVNSRIIDNPAGANVRTILWSGNGGTFSLVNGNVGTTGVDHIYTGGTVIQGPNVVVNLNGAAGTVVIPAAANPANGLVINGGTSTTTVNMVGTAGQIAASNIVTLNGNVSLNMFGNNTLEGLVFTNPGGGNVPPTVNTFVSAGVGMGVLTVGSSGIVSNPLNPAAVPTIGGRVDLGSSLNSITVGTYDFNGVTNFAPTTGGFNVQGMVGSAGGFTKGGNGVLQFLGQAVFTGGLNVTAGTVQIAAANAGSRFSTLTLQSGTRLNLNNASTILGGLGGSGTITNTGTAAQTLTVGFNGASTSFSGNFLRFNDALPNAVSLTKIGTGTLTFDAAGTGSTTTGALTVNRGTVAFKDNGTSSFPSAALTINEGGTLVLDNTGSAGVSNRLRGGAVTINGGTFSYLGRNGVASTEAAGILTLGASASVIDVTAGAGGTASLSFTSLTQAAGGTANFTGTNLGTTSKILFSTTAPTLVPATTGILARYAVNTVDFATYNSTSGIVPFTAYSTVADINTAAATATVKVDATTTALNLTAARTVNALNIVENNVNLGAVGSLLPTQGMTVTSGGILVNANGAAISSPVLAFGAAEGIFRVNGDSLSVSSSITGTGGLTKTGAGAMTLGAKQSYTGLTAVNFGTLTLAGGDNTILVAPSLTATVSNLQVNGGLLNLNGNSQVVGSLTNNNPLAFVDGVVTNLSGGAPVTLTSATTTASSFGGQLQGNLNFTKSGSGTLTFSDVQSYEGATIVRGATLTLQDRGALTGTTSVTLNYGTLALNNGGLNPLAELNPVRLAPTVPVTLRGGGLTITPGGSVSTTTTLNTVNVLPGANTITASVLGSAGANNVLTIGNLVLAPNTGTTLNFASDIGQPGYNGAQVFINQINGIAPVNNSFLGSAIILNNGEYGAYVTTQGAGRYGSTGFPAYAAALVSGVDLPTAISTNAADVAISGNTTIGALRFSSTATRTITFSGGTATGGAHVLNLALGGLLRSNENNAMNVGSATARGILTAGGTATSGTTDLVVYNNQNTITINSVIADNGLGNKVALVKSGAGAVTLTAANTYTGGTIVNQATLTINATAGAGTVVIPGDVTLNNANLTMSTNQGQIAASSNVTINGGGVLTLVGTNTLASVTFNNMGGTATPTVATATALTFTAANAITATNDNYSLTPTISGTALLLSNAAPVINVSGLAATGLVISAPITSAGGVISKTGDGALVLSGASTFNTGFNLNAGSLAFGVSTTGTLPTITNGPVGTGTLTLASGTAVRGDTAARTIGNPVSVLGDFTFGTLATDTARANANNALTLSGTVTLAAGEHTITVGGLLMTGTITGKLTGGSGLFKNGPGTLVLQNATNDYGGGTTVSAGTLQLGAANSIPDASALTVSTGAFVNLNGLADTVGSLSGGGVVTNTGAAAILTVGFDGTSTDFSGVLTAATPANLALVKTGAGTQKLSGASTYTGTTTVNAGVLEVTQLANGGLASSIGASTSAATSLVLNGGIIRYSGLGGSTDRNFTVGTNGGGLEASGAGAITFASTAAVTYAGTDTSPTFTLGGTNTGANVFSGQIGNNGTGLTSLVKNGTGTWGLTSVQSHSGGTLVSDGRLQISGLSGAGQVSVVKVGSTLANAPVLMGSGTIAGATTIGNPLINTNVGVLAPGVGNPSMNNQMLNFSHASGLTVATASQVQLTITAPTVTAEAALVAAISGGGYTNLADYLASYFTTNSAYPDWVDDLPGTTGSDLNHDYVSTTSLSLGNRVSTDFGQGTILVIDNGYSNAQLGDVFNLIDWVGAMNGGFATGPSHFGNGGSFGDLDMPALPVGLNWDVSAFQSFGIATVVPEPSRALLLFLGLMGLFFRRRRR